MYPTGRPNDLFHPTAAARRLDLGGPFESQGSLVLQHIADLTREASDDRTIRIAARGRPSTLRRRLGLVLMGLGDRIAGPPEAMRRAA